MNYNLTIIGTGYVGLVSGACFADIGHKVICVDKDAKKIDALKRGVIPIYEPGLTEIVKRNVKNGRLKFTTKLETDGANAIFLAVGTPTDPKTEDADMSMFYAAAKEVAAKLKHRCLIVTKSTVPVGTGAKLKTIFKDKASISSNPEFLREGNAVFDFMNPDRIVVGVNSKNCAKFLENLYAPIIKKSKAPFMATDIVSAELIKYASNTFLAAKVVFINEMADLCEAAGADVEEVAKGMGLDARIGDKFLKTGPGIGGSCFPKDARALAVQAAKFGFPSHIIEALVESNELRKENMAARIKKKVGKGTVAIFGLTFKANTNDMREAPAISIIPLLQKAGVKIKAYDPAGMEEAKHYLSKIEYSRSAAECAKGADAIVILTEWDEFKKLDYARLKPRKKVILDFRNILKSKPPKGWDYSCLGK